MYSNITAMHSTKCSDGKTMLHSWPWLPRRIYLVEEVGENATFFEPAYIGRDSQLSIAEIL